MSADMLLSQPIRKEDLHRARYPLAGLTDEQIEQELAWSEQGLHALDTDNLVSGYRSPRDQSRHNGYARHQERCQEEKARRKALTERLGPLSQESQDNRQLALF